MKGPTISGSPDDLVAEHILPRDHVHFAATMSRPNALLHAVARIFGGTRSLTVSLAAIHSNAHALAISGAVRRAVTCFLGNTCPVPRPCPIYQDAASGVPFEVELWSLLSFVQRLSAAAQGLDYATTASLIDTDLAAGKEDSFVTVPDPRHPDRTIALLRALRPDVALFHGVCADEQGNVVLGSPYGEGALAAYAARRGVLASVERIVPTDVTAAHPDRVVIPGNRVLGLCEAPFGAHPQSLVTHGFAGIPGYDDDTDVLLDITRSCVDPQAARRWFDSWVGLPGGHAEYLTRLQEKGTPVESPGLAIAHPDDDAPTDQEKAIVLAARAIVGLVRAHGYDTLLAGIGASHMAAWLAANLLRGAGEPVKVLAELGFYGMDPEPGDTYLFSRRHAVRSEQNTGILDVLGGQVAANERCLGVLSAAEIDQSGAINTTLLPDGQWITGSGGANDVATTTDTLVVAKASPRRYVREVAFMTSPGRKVRSIVCQFGRFERRPGASSFELGTWLPRNAGDDPGRLVADHTSWKVRTRNARPENPISKEDIRALRRIDAEGNYR